MKFIKFKPNLSSAQAFLILLLLGNFLLTGRFDTNSVYGLRALTLNMFLFTLILSFVFLTRSLLRKHLIRRFTYLSYFLFILFVFPYHFFGLDRYFYYANEPRSFHIYPKYAPVTEEGNTLIAGMKVSPNFHLELVSNLVNGTPSSHFPSKLFFYLIIAFIALILACLFKELRSVILYFYTYLVISWFFTSYASPYSFVPTLERPFSESYIYAVSQFSNGEGIVNADEGAHSSVTAIFQGYGGSPMIIKRPLAHYLASQFSYFSNQYYSWLAINLILIFLSIFAAKFFLKYLKLHPFTVHYALLFLSTLPISISYFAQTSAYSANLSISLIIFVFLFYLSQIQVTRFFLVSFLTIAFLIMLLTYDNLPWVISFCIILVLLNRDKWRVYIFGLTLSFVGFLIYRYVLVSLFFRDVHPGNEGIISESMKYFYSQLRFHNVFHIYNTLVDSPGELFWVLSYSVSILTFVIILIGIFYSRSLQIRNSNFSTMEPNRKRQLLNVDKSVDLAQYILIAVFCMSFPFLIFWSLVNRDNVGMIPRLYLPVIVLIILASAIQLNVIVNRNLDFAKILAYLSIAINLFVLTSLSNSFFKFFFNIVNGQLNVFNF
jgi:hypothetical protein